MGIRTAIPGWRPIYRVVSLDVVCDELMIVSGMFVCSSILISVCMFIVSKALLISSVSMIVCTGGAMWLTPLLRCYLVCVVPSL